MPDTLTNRDYLLSEQYANASNLTVRQQLHERYSTNSYGWHRWVFDQLDLPADARVLDLGCGPAVLWQRNAGRIPAGWQIILSDFSPGMLQEAQHNLSACGRPFAYKLTDAQAIAAASGSLDAVLANHMLYHVPDIPRALSEIQRVLKPGGRLYAATNGAQHMRELSEFLSHCGASTSETSRNIERFSLESGPTLLAPWFAEVTVRRYEDSLAVTEAGPLVAYVVSEARLWPFAVEDKLADLTRLLERRLAAHGVIRISKDAGLLIAQKGG